MNTERRRMVILGGDTATLPYVYHALAREHDVVRVVVEEKESRGTFLKRRVARLGFWTVVGQVLFALFCVPILARASGARTRELVTHYRFDGAPIDPATLVHVRSVNAIETQALLRELAPEVVVLHGTRIVHAPTLRATDATVLNIHTGLTPMYRGVHGGYWALASGHPEYFGVTLHLVDTGVDTGEVVAQKVCAYTREDTFATYPLIQLGEGLALLTEALRAPAVATHPPTEAPFSKLWYHPTLWGYLWCRIRHGVK